MKIISIALATILVTINTMAGTAIPYPFYAGMPPADVTLMDTIYNVFGLTRPQISDDTDRLEAYLDLYRNVLGASYDSFYDDLSETLAKAKTSGKISISQNLSEQLQAGMYEALQSGFEIGEPTAGQFTPTAWQTVLSNIGVTVSLDKLTNLYNETSHNGRDTVAMVYLYSNNYLILGCYVYGGNNGYTDVKLSTWGDYGSFEGKLYNGSIGNPAGGNRWIYSVNNGVAIERVNGTYGAMFWGSPYPKSGITGNTEPTAGIYTHIQAQDGVFGKLAQGILQVLTPFSEVIDGVLNTTNPIVIPLPTGTLTPADNLQGVAGVQDETDTKPYVDSIPDVAEMVQTLRESAEATYGEAQEYALDLTQYFPFCLPFDVYRLLSAFVAEPEAPHFDWEVINPWGENWVFTIDLSMFDSVASVLRNLEKIAFVIGLAVVTRQMYLRG